jgi:hypothetical protein
MDLNTFKTTKARPYTRKWPDSWSVGSSYNISPGNVRLIPQDHLDKLALLDKEIAALEERKHTLLREAWMAGEPLPKPKEE